MSDKIGARAFYIMLDAIKDTLLNDQDINTVTYGDLSEVDLGKQTIFPLAHIVINGAQNTGSTMVFNVTVLCLDIVDISKEPQVDPFIKYQSEHNILNTQLAVTNRLFQKFYQGNLRTNGYAIDEFANCEPVIDKFENQLAGWSITFDFIIRNDLYIC